MKSLVWLRSDLRLNDNPALMAACKNHEEVHAVYIFSKNQFNSHNESNVKVDFIISNLFHLEKSLRELNIPLTVINSSGFEEDPQAIQLLLSERNINHIYWNTQFGEDQAFRLNFTFQVPCLFPSTTSSFRGTISF